MITVDKGIPMPGKLQSKWPFAEMDVGDSFVVEQDKFWSVQSGMRAYGNRYGKCFTIRKLDGMQRCWRIS